MQELKKDFELSDVRLVQLISNNRDQLSITMEAFSKISAKINSKLSFFFSICAWECVYIHL